MVTLPCTLLMAAAMVRGRPGFYLNFLEPTSVPKSSCDLAVVGYTAVRARELGSRPAFRVY